MAKLDVRKETIDAIVRRISDLNEQSLNQLSQYISYLKWQEELWHSLLDEEIEPLSVDQALLWQFDFIEGFPGARKAATRKPDMMEIKVARLPAAWCNSRRFGPTRRPRGQPSASITCRFPPG